MTRDFKDVRARTSQRVLGTNDWRRLVTYATIPENTAFVMAYIELRGEDLKEGIYLEAHLVAKSEQNAFEIPRKLLVDNQSIYVLKDSVIDLMPDQVGVTAKGGTMRLGAYDAVLKDGSKVAEVYGGTAIDERHRHRYEVDIKYREKLESAGLCFSGMSPDGRLPEIVEWQDHPWFIGVQFHPELKSKPFAPHPLFADFVRAALDASRLV